MVLENIYSVEWLRQKPYFAILLGIAYTVLGIAGAMLIFPDDPALLSVAFIGLLLVPSLQKLSSIEERVEKKERGFWHAFLDQKKFIAIYFYLFIGIFITFSVLSLMMPSLAANYFFKAQLSMMTGDAAFTLPLLGSLMANNIIVLFICFMLSLIAGNGAIFFIAWNASIWGTIFGSLASTASHISGKSPVILFILILISVLPHMVLEVMSYIIATLSGTLISEGVNNEGARSSAFRKILKYNVLLLLIAIAVLFIGMILETIALDNYTTYQLIIQMAFG